MYGVAQLITRRLVTPWQGPVTNGVPPNPTQEWYMRGDGIKKMGHKRVHVIEVVEMREQGKPHWRWSVFPLRDRDGPILEDEVGYAATKEDAFAECDRRLLAAGFCVPGDVYT